MQKSLALILIFIMGFTCYGATNKLSDVEQEGKNGDFFPEEYTTYRLEEPWQKGEDIAEIQKFLKELAFYEGAIDGIYGPQTSRGVNDFRQSRGLFENGLVDLSFYQAMSEVYERELLPEGKEISISQGETILVIVLSELTLYVLEDGAVKAKFPVAIGKPKTPSPLGEWKIISRGAKKGSQFGTRWLGLNVPWGVYGIHGTNRPYSIGTMASAGCIRMFNRDVENLYQITREGMLVFIIDDPFGEFARGLKILKPGDTGSHVLYLQRRLRQLGFFKREVNGFYDWWTQQAVLDYQRAKGLADDGVIVPRCWQELGIFPFE